MQIVKDKRPTIGVMASSSLQMSDIELQRLTQLAQILGKAIADRNCILVTGATTGFPDIVSRSAGSHGGLTIGVSPASSREEHTKQYALPDDGVDVIVYTGFGLKGRNVINVRSSDVVIIFGGGIGTLNEFTIAHDEGKVIGVLEGTGSVADRVREITALSDRTVGPELLFGSSPEELIDACLTILARRSQVIALQA